MLVALETSPAKGAGAGDGQMSEAKQARQKAGLPGQASSLGKRMEEEAVCPVECRSGEEYTAASSHCREESGVVKAQREMKVARNAGHDKKSGFKDMDGKEPPTIVEITLK